VRVRFVDEAADYQTGGAAVRAEAPGGAGAEDLDLPLVTDAAAARRVAARRLRRASAERDALRLPVGPLEAMTREPGDRVEVAGRDGLWRVVRVDADERPSLSLVRCEGGDAPAAPEPWAEPGVGDPPLAAFGPPVMHVLDLGPMPGSEADGRPLVAASADPWRPLSVWAGLSAEALTVRARVERPAALGVTLDALAPASGRRLDRSRLRVRIEGGRPEARSWAALASGAGAARGAGADGEWEVMQHLGAELVEPDVWALDGFARALAGSDPAAGQAKPAGAAVVLLTAAVVRAETGAAERGADLLWRAAPADGPAGGLGTAETVAPWRGLALRPWAPAHLRAERLASGDVRFGWTRRARLDGERWDGEPPLSEEVERYRVEVLAADGAVLRAWEVGAGTALWTAAEQAVEAPGGLGGAAIPREPGLRVVRLGGRRGARAGLNQPVVVGARATPICARCPRVVHSCDRDSARSPGSPAGWVRPGCSETRCFGRRRMRRRSTAARRAAGCPSPPPGVGWWRSRWG
jgi:hypothetical protein